MEKNERLKEAIEYLRSQGVVYLQKDIAERMKATSPNVSAAINGNPKNLTDEFLMRFNVAFGNVFNLSWLTTGEGTMLRQQSPVEEADNAYRVPLIPVLAQGGSLTNCVDSVRAADCEMIVSPVKGADYAITIYGDSMYPDYPSGSHALIKRINERAFVEWGKVYVLDTCNGVVIKRLMPTADTSIYRCESLNDKYPPFEVATDNIYGIYRVLMVMIIK